MGGLMKKRSAKQRSVFVFYFSTDRKLDEEIRACARALRLYPDAAAARFHHLFGDEEPEAR